MAFFRREKDSVEEFRRTRQGLSRGMDDQGGRRPSSPYDSDDHTDDDALLAPAAATQLDPKQDMVERFRRNATTVARDTAFSGSLKSNTNLLIEGQFEGQLEARDTIFIAQGAEVKADVRASDVIVAGVLDGTVDASGRFHVMPSAQVAGEINTAILVVDQDSHVSCRFKMKPRGEKG
jgi:cytoskeletal protein CcmA (bactofilin family)